MLFSNMSQETYKLELLEQSWIKWHSSAALRAYYETIYNTIDRHRASGPTLEVGSGIGVSKIFMPDITTSDILKTKYVDTAVSCYNIDRQARWRNIVALDVLHHLRYPMRFLRSASKALKPNGTIVLMEPAATFAGNLLYGLFHHELIILKQVVPPFEFYASSEGEEFSNMAMAQGIFDVHKKVCQQKLGEIGLNLLKIEYRDLAAYFFTGGFSHQSFLPASIVKRLVALENKLPQTVLRKMGLRMLIVLQRLGRNFD